MGFGETRIILEEKVACSIDLQKSLSLPVCFRHGLNWQTDKTKAWNASELGLGGT